MQYRWRKHRRRDVYGCIAVEREERRGRKKEEGRGKREEGKKDAAPRASTKYWYSFSRT
jgi:hypothetical protein